MTKFIVNNRLIKNWHQFVFYGNKWSNCPLSLADASHEFQIHVSVRILTIKISQWARENFCSYRKKRVSMLSRNAENSPSCVGHYTAPNGCSGIITNCGKYNFEIKQQDNLLNILCCTMHVNIWNIEYLNCRERYEDIHVDHRCYIVKYTT